MRGIFRSIYSQTTLKQKYQKNTKTQIDKSARQFTKKINIKNK